MGTYKVLQDVEADDKLVGPLSLRQFIYAAVAGFCGWIGAMAVTNNAGFLLIFFVPIMLFSAFLAFPWGKDQPTELWALAKVRFFLKPHKRIWDQSGAKDLVTVTAPKHIDRHLTNGLSQSEVHSRLNALASTIDSRGWAVKNVNVNVSSVTPSYSASDRLVDVSSMPQEVSSVDVQASDDMLDANANPVAHQFDAMMQHAADEQRQRLMTQMSTPEPAPQPSSAQQATTPPNDFWFLNQPTATVPGQATFANSTVVQPAPSSALAQDTIVGGLPAGVPIAAEPTDEEEAFISSHKPQEATSNTVNAHLKTIKTPRQLADEALQERADAARKAAEESVLQNQQARMTSERQADIMNLANNDDLNITTIARQASKHKDNDNGEVVISLR